VSYTAGGGLTAPSYGVFGTALSNVGAAITAPQTGAPVQYSTSAGVVTPLVPGQDVILVGAAAGTVALHNLTAGALSAASKDAVNGSQLFATNANVTTVTAQTTTLGNNTATDLGGGASYTAGGGLTAPSYGVFGTTQTSVGAAITALQNKAPLQYSTNAGVAMPLMPGQDTTLVGAAAGTVALHNLTAGSAGTDAVNYGQLTASASAAGTQTATLGTTAATDLGGGVTYTASGGLTAPSYGVFGTAQTNLGAAITALQTGAPLQFSTNAGVATPLVPSQDVTLVGAAAGTVALHNLTAGAISAASKDAVNGSQLFATNANVTTVTAQTTTLGNNTAMDLGGGASYTAGGGLTAPSYGVFGTTQTNVGSAITALQNKAPLQYSTAGGSATPLVPSQDVTLVGAAAGTVALHNLTAGSATTDAVNYGQLTAAGTQTTTLGTTAATDLGGGASYTAGGGLTAPSYGVFGTTQTTVGAAITALQNKAPLQYSTTGGSATPLVPSQDTTLVGASAGTVALHNLTAGSAPTDAVNYGQLSAAAGSAATQTTTLGTNTASDLGGGASYTAGGGLTAPSYGVFGTTRTTVGAAITALQNSAPVQYSTAGGTPAPQVPGQDVTLAGAAPGVVALHNVKAGSAATDAVNVSQLASTNAAGGLQTATLGTTAAANFGGGVNYSGAGGLTAPNYGVFGTTQTSVGGAITALQTAAPLQYSTSAGSATPLVPSNDVTLVGSSPGTVALHNLTAGAVSAASTDAVNGSQLFATNANVTSVTAQTTTLGTNSAADLGGGASYTAGGGLTAPSYGVFGTAQTNVGAAITALQNKAPLQYSTAGGSATPLVPSQDLTLVGAASATVALHNLTAGVVATDAVNMGQLATASAAAGAQTTTLGTNLATALGGGVSYTAGGGLTAPNYGVFGTTQTSVGGAITALQNAAPMQYSTSAGSATPLVPGQDVTLVGAASGTVALHNVTAGTALTDAVNVGQLTTTTTAAASQTTTLGTNTATILGGGASYTAGGGLVAPAYGVFGTIRNTVEGSITALQTLAPVQYSTPAGSATPQVRGEDVTLVGASPGTVALHNLTAGTGTTDAVNYGQLTTVNAALQAQATTVGTTAAMALGGGASYSANGGITAPGYAIFGATQGSVGAAVAALQSLAPVQYATPAGSATPSVRSQDVTLAGAAGGPVGLHNVAIGQLSGASTDAVNGSQLFATNAALTASGSNLSALGGSAAVTLGGGAAYTATGGLTAPNYGVFGTSQTNVGAAVNALQTLAPVQFSTASGVPSPFVPGNDVTLAGAASGPVGLHNVAAGQITGTSTDAVNGGQLFATNAATAAAGAQGTAQVTAQTTGLGTGLAATLGGGAGYTVSGGLTAPSYSVFGTTQTNLGAAITALQTGGPVQYSTPGGVATSFVPGNDVRLQGSGAGLVALHALAPGVAATDAVDVGQLNAAIIAADGPVRTGDLAVFTTSATGAGSLAVGGAASAVAGATAIGANASATVAQSVALGSNAITRAGVNTASATIAGTPYSFAGSNPAVTGIASFGAPGSERQLQNVAAGQLAATSTDGVNGSQLFATNTAVGAVATQSAALGTAVASSLGGGAGYTSSGGFTAPSYTVFGTTQMSVGAALTALQTNGPLQYAGPTGLQPLIPSNDVMLVGAAAGGVGLHNLAPGQLSGGSTDAVNGSQLYAVAATVGAIAGGGGTKFMHVNSTRDDGYATGTNAISIGPAATASGAQSIVIGNGANDNGAASATVLGQGASIAAGLVGTNVALGKGSTVTASAAGTSGTTIGGQTYSFAGPAPVGTVSVGSAAATRVVANVAAGALMASSTDAVNGSQLYATNAAVNALNTAAGGGALNFFHANSSAGALSQATGANAIAVGSNSAASGVNAIAQGIGSSAMADNALALGTNATASVDNSAALGAGSVAMRGSAASYAAAGLMAPQQSAGEISVGKVGATRQLTNLAAGSQATDAVTVAQLQGVQAASVHYDPSAGGPNFQAITLAGAGGTTLNNVAPGTLAADSMAAVNGGQLYAANQVVAALGTGLASGTLGAFRADNTSNAAPPSANGANAVAGGFGAFAAARGSVAIGASSIVTGTEAVAVGSGAVATAANSVAIGAGSVASRGALQSYQGAGLAGPSRSSGEVSFGSVGQERQLTNVAPAIAGTDAVNVNQLGAFAAATDRRFRSLQTDTRAGTALALASGQLRYDDHPGKLSMGFGTGVFQGTLGMALGFGKISEDGKWKYNASASFSPTNMHVGGGFGAGITYSFN